MLKTKVYGRIAFEMPWEAKRADVKLPCGTIENIPVFDRQKVNYAYDHHGYETVSKSGDIIKEARFTARVAGVHEMFCYDKNGDVLIASRHIGGCHKM